MPIKISNLTCIATYYAFFRSSWAFFTSASLEWGSVTGSPTYGASWVPWSISPHSLTHPVWGTSPENLIYDKTISYTLVPHLFTNPCQNKKMSLSYLNSPSASRIFSPCMRCHEWPFHKAIMFIIIICAST